MKTHELYSLHLTGAEHMGQSGDQQSVTQTPHVRCTPRIARQIRTCWRGGGRGLSASGMYFSFEFGLSRNRRMYAALLE